MKIFLSWSGPHSRAVAEALNDWLRRVIQAVKPFYSPEIEKGAKWSNEIDNALEGTSFGVICLTPENLDSRWIHFEAGALSKTPGALIWTFLSDLTAADVPPPLGKFQHTIANKEDTLQLIKTINRRLSDAGGDPLVDSLLEENFNLFWPQLEKRLDEARNATRSKTRREKDEASGGSRDERAILDEILELARSQERRLLALETQSVAPQSPRVSQESKWGMLVLRVNNIEGSKVPQELSKTLADMLPDAKITVDATDATTTDIKVELATPLSEKHILTIRKVAAHAIGILEPSYSLVKWS